jgi:uncharacterized protein YutE (UPF0331/DUF86 family)
MLQRSPILRFALEVFEHALESAVSERPRDRKLAVINLAQAVELAIKAALVEKNLSIYTKDSRTITSYDALRLLAELWTTPRVAMHSRMEVLIDERNAIQHRYGNVDDVTLDYHLETAFKTLEEILQREFDIELSDWIRDNLQESVWKRVRFVQVPETAVAPPSEASLPDRSPALDLVDGFSRYETAIRDIVRGARGEKPGFGSTLDFAIKTLASLEHPPRDVIRELPDVYRLRNRVIHGEGSATDDEVKAALSNLDAVLTALKSAPTDLLQRALETVRLGVRGARVLTTEEIQSLNPASHSQSTEGDRVSTMAPVRPEASSDSTEQVH